MRNYEPSGQRPLRCVGLLLRCGFLDDFDCVELGQVWGGCFGMGAIQGQFQYIPDGDCFELFYEGCVSAAGFFDNVKFLEDGFALQGYVEEALAW